ncbi:cache domain-containing protein [Desulfospira joergensenii]|uniref:cache domain-containing protein n=1 Tax=Desulfospira joergensenii TaxID=53329 RepID=UPI0004883A53|nr:cache domain-containing protein [Desulfospira joergensenii]
MKKKLTIAVLVSLFMFCFTGLVPAQEKATKEECIEKCKEAAQMVQEKGLDATLAVIMDKNGPFVWKDTYIFCIDIEKKANIAHPIKPKLIGKNLMHVKDTGGKLFFAEFINTAKGKGAGWVEYMWPKPGEKKPSKKMTYVYKVPGESVFMAAGIYE